MSLSETQEILQRLEKIERLVESLIDLRTIQEWYTPAEIADQIGKAEFTVREWCRLGRVHAEKKPSGRGVAGEWRISHEEFMRIRHEGLLPVVNPYRHIR